MHRSQTDPEKCGGSSIQSVELNDVSFKGLLQNA